MVFEHRSFRSSVRAPPLPIIKDHNSSHISIHSKKTSATTGALNQEQQTINYQRKLLDLFKGFGNNSNSVQQQQQQQQQQRHGTADERVSSSALDNGTNGCKAGPPIDSSPSSAQQPRIERRQAPLTIEEYESDLRQYAGDLELVQRVFCGGIGSNKLRATLWPYIFGLVKHRGRFIKKSPTLSSTNGSYRPARKANSNGDASTNSHANGHANGHTNGHANGHSSGRRTNGLSNGPGHLSANGSSSCESISSTTTTSERAELNGAGLSGAKGALKSADENYIYIEHEENLKRWRELEKLYRNYESQWKSIMPEQELRFSVFRERKALIERDVIRSDRTHPFYADSSTNLNNFTTLLMTYMMYDFDIGYLQGMSDLAAPILYVYQGDLVKSFWVFVEVMKLFRRNFEASQKTIHFQLNCLYRLIKLTDPKLAHYLRNNECSNCFFVFRCIVCQFKRELMKGNSVDAGRDPHDGYLEVLNLWDTIWCVQKRHELLAKSKCVHTYTIANGGAKRTDARLGSAIRRTKTATAPQRQHGGGGGGGLTISTCSQQHLAAQRNGSHHFHNHQGHHQITSSNNSSSNNNNNNNNIEDNDDDNKLHQQHHQHHHHHHHHNRHLNHTSSKQHYRHHHLQASNNDEQHLLSRSHQNICHLNHLRQTTAQSTSSTHNPNALSQQQHQQQTSGAQATATSPLYNATDGPSIGHLNGITTTHNGAQRNGSPTSTTNGYHHSAPRRQSGLSLNGYGGQANSGGGGDGARCHHSPTASGLASGLASFKRQHSLTSLCSSGGSSPSSPCSCRLSSLSNGAQITNGNAKSRGSPRLTATRCHQSSTSCTAETSKAATEAAPVKQEQIVYTKETFYSSFDPNQADVPRFELTETEKFVLSLCLSLIRRERDQIMLNSMDASEIHQHFINPHLTSDFDHFLDQAYEVYQYLNSDCDLQLLVRGANELNGAASDLSPILMNGNGGHNGEPNDDDDDCEPGTADTYDLLKDYLIISPTSYNISLTSLNNLHGSSGTGGKGHISFRNGCGGGGGGGGPSMRKKSSASRYSVSQKSWDHFLNEEND